METKKQKELSKVKELAEVFTSEKVKKRALTFYSSLESFEINPKILEKLEKTLIKELSIEWNRDCNANCSFCYLGPKRSITDYDSESGEVIEESILEKIVQAGLSNYGIEAAEPLVNRKSVRRIMAFYEMVKKYANQHNKKQPTMSIITNGINISNVLEEYGKSFFDIFSTIDISLHPSIRKEAGVYERVLTGLKQLNKLGVPFNFLHVIGTQKNNKDLEEVIRVGESLKYCKLIQLSPYFNNNLKAKGVTDNKEGYEGVEKSVFKYLADHEPFLNSDKAYLAIDPYHLIPEDLTIKDVIEMRRDYNLEGKVFIITRLTPFFGILRLTKDGKVTTIFDANFERKFQKDTLDLKEIPADEVKEQLEYFYKTIIEKYARGEMKKEIYGKEINII